LDYVFLVLDIRFLVSQKAHKCGFLCKNLVWGTQVLILEGSNKSVRQKKLSDLCFGDKVMKCERFRP